MPDLSPKWIPSDEAPLYVLKARILVAIVYPHNHAGIPGVPEGSGCPRCNAEKALVALIERSGDARSPRSAREADSR